jgi:hypothetical protein
MQLQTNVMNYAANGVVTSAPPAPAPANGRSGGSTPDFAKMTPAQKIAYHKARWDRVLG